MSNAIWPTSQSELFVYLVVSVFQARYSFAVFLVRHVSLSQLVEVKDGLRFCLVRIREPFVAAPFSINFAFLVGAFGRLFRLAGSVRLGSRSLASSHVGRLDALICNTAI